MMKNLRRLINWIGIGLLLASVVIELRKPAHERTWHGRIAGLIPYDLRPPTLERIRATFWNSSEPQVIVPTLCGVGWSVNLHALLGKFGAIR